MEFLVHVILIWMGINLVLLAIVVEKDFRRIHSRPGGGKAEKPVLQRKNGSSSQADITAAPNE
ncbi:hypothetical protein RA307_17605 [Xanthobacteraceae bacterium Astr-EGSB]|uniref:hypothetical protein n=1 Tax=Astrobacterium formosum TaxID=3069710 RepID=UPI0027B310DD|nr:hypothetical protein [Xanthobacteraceae bacterium Astr-EGSB]